MMLVDFQPEQLWGFVAAMLVLSVTYGLIGMLVGAVFNRLAGLWAMLILPMIDIGLFQDLLFVQSEHEWWMKLFPDYHPVRVMVDTGLATDMDTAASLGWGSATSSSESSPCGCTTGELERRDDTIERALYP